MTVAEALTGPFNNLGYRLRLLMAKKCAKHGLRCTDAVTEMFMRVRGNEDLSSQSDYLEVGRDLELFISTLELSLKQQQLFQTPN